MVPQECCVPVQCRGVPWPATAGTPPRGHTKKQGLEEAVCSVGVPGPTQEGVLHRVKGVAECKGVGNKVKEVESKAKSGIRAIHIKLPSRINCQSLKGACIPYSGSDSL